MAIEENAENRIRLAIGTQFVELQVLQDQIASLRDQLAERDRTIVAMGNQLAAASVAPGGDRPGGNLDE